MIALVIDEGEETRYGVSELLVVDRQDLRKASEVNHVARIAGVGIGE